MRLGKITAILALLVGGLLLPATTAQAEAATQAAPTACAPVAQDKWLGTYKGPHKSYDGFMDGTVELRVFVKDGALTVQRNNRFQQPAELRDGLLYSSNFVFDVDARAANCAGNGTVTEFSGLWYYNYCVPEHCPSAGTFTVTRI